MKHLLLLLTLLSPFGIGHSSFAAAQRPNILFILADDMGWQDTSVPFAKARTKWNDRFSTPALERLARDGMKFTQAYSCAVCSPTRVSLITGQNEMRHHVTQWTHLSGDAPTTDRPHSTLSSAAWNCNGLQPTPGLAHAVSAPALPALLKQAGYARCILARATSARRRHPVRIRRVLVSMSASAGGLQAAAAVTGVRKTLVRRAARTVRFARGISIIISGRTST